MAYFDELKKEGLTYPSSTLLHAFLIAHAIFNICISKDYEKIFLKSSNPKNLFLQANCKYWEHCDFLQSFDTSNLCLKNH